MKTFALSAFLGLTLTTSATALPLLDQGSQAQAFADPFFTTDYDFNGIVSLSNCSGSLVRFDDSQDSDPGMVLTNGHCVQMMRPGQVYVNTMSFRGFSVLNSAGEKIGQVRARTLLYATMTDTDMAIYQLRESFQTIQDQYDVTPLTLSRDYAEVGDPIEIISGYWKRGYSCEIEAFVHRLKEADWIFKESMRYSQPGCNVIGGTSGSPVVLAGTKTIIGVNNTGNESGRECEMNNPCEIDEDGTIRYEIGFNYAQQTSWIYSCRRDNGQLDLGVEGCRLPKP